MKKAIRIVGSIILGIVVIGVAGAYCIFREEIEIIGTIKKVNEETPVYTMTINGDYYFNEFLEQGGAKSDQEVAAFLTNRISHGFYQVDVENKGAGCSVISALNAKSDHVWGRNFDWTEATPIIVRNNPKSGYASLSTCEFGNITGKAGILPEDMQNKMLAVSALYVPMDGMNEKGLCVADLAVNEGGMVTIDTDKPDLTITTAIHLILNKAATVDEAIALLKQYDIFASADISHHLAISDAEGNSVAVEFMEGGMVVVPSPYVTNFNMANGDRAAGGEGAQKRFETLEAIYNQHEGTLEAEDIEEALKQTAQLEGKWKTRWSIIYNTSTQTADYYFEGNIEKPLSFKVTE